MALFSPAPGYIEDPGRSERDDGFSARKKASYCHSGCAIFYFTFPKDSHERKLNLWEERIMTLITDTTVKLCRVRIQADRFKVDRQ